MRGTPAWQKLMLPFLIGLALLFSWFFIQLQQIAALRQQSVLLQAQIDALPRTTEPKDRITLQKVRIDADKDRITLENGTYGTVIQALGGIFFFVTAYFTARNLEATENKQVTERFSKAIEQLEHTGIHARLGGIYALERIAKDSEKDYWQVMEVLTAFVREKAPWPTLSSPALPSTDIQAILTVLSRRSKFYGKGEEHSLDLRQTNLQKANLDEINLRGADLRKASLQKASLWQTNLQNANLEEADCRDTELGGANLQEANFRKVNFQEAKLERANLQGARLRKADCHNAKFGGANFYQAKLGEANFEGANLQKADLREATLWKASFKGADLQEAKLRGAQLEEASFVGAIGLTLEQVKSAKGWERASFDEELRKKLGLQP
jgi:uncharacterized protein YjbI with pentapeptide repeats